MVTSTAKESGVNPVQDWVANWRLRCSEKQDRKISNSVLMVQEMSHLLEGKIGQGDENANKGFVQT